MMDNFKIERSKLGMIYDMFSAAYEYIFNGIFFDQEGYMIVVYIFYVLFYNHIFIVNGNELIEIDEVKSWVNDNLKKPYRVIYYDTEIMLAVLIFHNTDATAFKLRWT